MAKKGGAPENLDPVRTKDEAKKRGHNGGVKSGEVRRQKRDAKNAINLLLDMAAKGKLDDNLKELGVETESRTNMVALQARLFTMAMSGNLTAYDKLMKYAGYDPEENRKERESLAADSRREREAQARIDAYANGDSYGQYADGSDPFEDEEQEDVIIVLPDDGRNAHMKQNSTGSTGEKTESTNPETTVDGEKEGDNNG